MTASRRPTASAATPGTSPSNPFPAGQRITRSEATSHSLPGRPHVRRDIPSLATINSTVRGAVADAGVPTTKVLDLASAFNGRRLCENTVGLCEEQGIAS